jgi:beta-lactamase regulating signal transducer with metallopeptidase domain
MNILIMNWSASIIILIVIVARALFFQKLPKPTFMALWGIAMCRLLLPFSIPSRLNIWNIMDTLRTALQNKAAAPEAALVTQALNDAVTALTPGGAAETALPALTNINAGGAAGTAGGAIAGGAASTPWFLYLWLAGVCGFTLYFLITHLCCQNVYKAALPVDNAFIKHWLAAHPIRRTVYVRQSDKVNAPLSYGLLRPVILLPSSTDWRDESCLSYILTHEYVHIRRFDILYKWILAAVLSINWFNPLVWLMYVFANRDIELSCDETVVWLCGEKGKSVYALTLLALAEKRSRLISLYTNFSKTAVEERVMSIMKIKKNSLLSILAALVLVSGVLLMFATTKAVSLAYDGASPSYNSRMSFVGQLDYVERMLFVTRGESAVKVTYDGDTWAPYTPILQAEDWKWYTYDEYLDFIEYIKTKQLCAEISPLTIKTMDKEMVKLDQTLKDIKNGIRVSKYKAIYISDGIKPLFLNHWPSESDPVATTQINWIMWYCFGYTFIDKAGNEVDLGLFETRDQLFAALKQYYDNEVAAGRLTQDEAAGLYGHIAHKVRNNDEVPLADKLRGVSEKQL